VRSDVAARTAVGEERKRGRDGERRLRVRVLEEVDARVEGGDGDGDGDDAGGGREGIDVQLKARAAGGCTVGGESRAPHKSASLDKSLLLLSHGRGSVVVGGDKCRRTEEEVAFSGLIGSLRCQRQNLRPLLDGDHLV
jgi:hypothetical protein